MLNTDATILKGNQSNEVGTQSKPRNNETMAPVFSLLFSVCTLNSCSKNDNQIDGGGTEIPMDLKSDQLVAADNQFGLEMVKQVNAELEEGKNLMISPMSISLALAMAYNGAEGDTKTQMEEMLHKAGMSADQINQTYQGLVKALSSHDPKVQLSIANAIFYNQSFSIKPDFITTNQTYYNAEVEALNFSNTNATLNHVNGWVRSNTNNKIHSIIDKVSPYDVMYLINAIYFKGEWTYQFEKKNTKTRTFHTASDGDVQVPMMELGKTKFQFLNTEKFTALELPYGSGKFSMLIMLPNEKYTTDDVIAALNPTNLTHWLSQLHELETVVFLPKFEFTYENSLVDNLKALGMLDAFNAAKSDFSGISDQQDLYISEVKHKSYIKVDEEGTEAAAVTGITFDVTSVEPNSIFNVDHPFIFAIREKDTNALLFIGKVNNPLLDE
ncbi:MAG TPA: serpin family protein [Sunxiuqinia sp.]|nr:serpin family protein [Sunxiuqinia sp.]